MKLAVEIYARRPLGRLLRQILDILSKYPLTAPIGVSLFSRSGRTDIPLSEILDVAGTSASDTCTIRAESGDIQIRWLYGPRAGAQTITGRLTLEPKCCSELRNVLRELCLQTDAIYGLCDRESVVDSDIRLVGGMVYREQAFVGLYWFNFFGHEYRDALTVNDTIRAQASELGESEQGLLLILGANPAAKEESNAKAIAELWPVFQRYRAGARFPKTITIDYSEVRGLDQPASAVATIASTVGPPDHFIASVSAHAQRFNEWARAKGLPATTEQDFQRIFRLHEAVIRDELLVPTIAAYGEAVRVKIGGVWRKAEIFHRGEPVVAKPGRPWTARRVILEVLEGLEPAES